MLLDILDNLPRLRLSSNHFRLILWLLKQLGVRETPSYDAFRKIQKSLTSDLGNKTEQHTSSIGNIFYVNDINVSVAQVCSLLVLLMIPFDYLTR